MDNPYLSNHPMWLDHFKERRRKTKGWPLLCFLAILTIALWVGHSMDPQKAGRVNLLFMLTYGFFLYCASQLNDWASKLDLHPVDRRIAKNWASYISAPGNTPGTAVWDLAELERNLAQELASNWELGYRRFHALKAEGVSEKQILEHALRRGDDQLAEIIFNHWMEGVNVIRRLALPLTGVAFFFAYAFILLLDHASSISDLTLPVLIAFAVASGTIMLWERLRGGDPGQWVKPLKLILAMLTTILLGVYGSRSVINKVMQMGDVPGNLDTRNHPSANPGH